MNKQDVCSVYFAGVCVVAFEMLIKNNVNRVFGDEKEVLFKRGSYYLEFYILYVVFFTAQKKHQMKVLSNITTFIVNNEISYFDKSIPSPRTRFVILST